MGTEVNQITFKVSDGGTLSIDGMDGALTRGDCWALYLSNNPDADEIMSLADENWDAKQVVGEVYLERTGADSYDPDIDPEDLREWLEADPENVVVAASNLQLWLADTTLNEEDYDTADRSGVTTHGAALRFWRDGDLDPDDFGIVIVEGEHPGSSYYAAELRESIEYANAQAEKLGAAVRFV
jgi:hypothetical protein